MAAVDRLIGVAWEAFKRNEKKREKQTGDGKRDKNRDRSPRISAHY